MKTNHDDIQEAYQNPIEIPRPEKESDKVRDEFIWETLTLRQEQFCRLYALEGRFFGNWAACYEEVYDIDKSKANWYKTVCAAASRLLSNVKVFNRINELLDENGLNDVFVDKQLLYLLSQHDDKSSKLWAIKEYNKVKWRIQQKIEHSGSFSLLDLANRAEMEED